LADLKIAAASILSAWVVRIVPLRGPPKVTLATISGTRILPISSPAGVCHWTPSQALIQRLPATSTRKPSGRPGVMSANRRILQAIVCNLKDATQQPGGSCGFRRPTSSEMIP
jgi:hypothetical protein